MNIQYPARIERNGYPKNTAIVSALALVSAAPQGAGCRVATPPGVWPADALAVDGWRTVPTAHPPLDAQLPGGGWPLGALIELLQPAPDAPVWPLVLPALVARQRSAGGALALVGSPHEPFVPALAAAGVRADAVLWLTADAPVARLWLAEQALACGDVAAVLAWLPRARSADLRRLHLAAARRGEGLLFALRPAAAAASASPAPLRIAVERADGSTLALRLRLLKRRGPPLVEPLLLARGAPLCDVLAASAGVQAQAPQGVPNVDWVLPRRVSAGGVCVQPEVGDAVVRLAVAA